MLKSIASFFKRIKQVIYRTNDQVYEGMPEGFPSQEEPQATINISEWHATVTVPPHRRVVSNRKLFFRKKKTQRRNWKKWKRGYRA